MDLLMLTLLNSQERTEKEFEELFKVADERFVFKVGRGSRLVSPVFANRFYERA
jgi:hypothetical protein